MDTQCENGGEAADQAQSNVVICYHIQRHNRHNEQNGGNDHAHNGHRTINLFHREQGDGFIYMRVLGAVDNVSILSTFADMDLYSPNKKVSNRESPQVSQANLSQTRDGEQQDRLCRSVG
jgi:hypothetical protein